jgi:hypothetical protein
MRIQKKGRSVAQAKSPNGPAPTISASVVIFSHLTHSSPLFSVDAFLHERCSLGEPRGFSSSKELQW